MVRKMYRALRHKKLRHRGWWKKISKPLFQKSLWMPCRDTVATGLAVGLFFAVLPIPAQSLFAALVAMALRSNVPFAMAACWISNPVTNVPIWIGQLFLGNWVHEHFNLPMPEGQIKLPGIGGVPVGNFVLGSVVSGVLLALLAFPLVHLLSRLMPHHLPVRSYLENKRNRRAISADPTKPVP